MFKRKELAENELPPKHEAIQKGLDFVANIENDWKPTASYDGVQTYTEWVNDDDFWAARISYHQDLEYQEMLETLAHNHTEHEAEYIHLVESWKPLEGHGDWESREIHYKFPVPFRDRDMIIWITSEETKPGSQFVVVTLPRLGYSCHTKAHYVSVEVVNKLSDGHIQWIMATTSDAGGWVPHYLQRWKLPSAIAQDVPQYLQWIKERRQKLGDSH